jgi:hypothetical protein
VVSQRSGLNIPLKHVGLPNVDLAVIVACGWAPFAALEVNRVMESIWVTLEKIWLDSQHQKIVNTA